MKRQKRRERWRKLLSIGSSAIYGRVVHVWDTEQDGIYFKLGEEQAEKYLLLKKPEDIKDMQNIQLKHLKRVLGISRVKDLEWFMSGDTGEDDFIASMDIPRPTPLWG